MDIELLKEFLGLCVFVNIVLLVLASLVLILAGDFGYKGKSRFVPVSRESFTVVVFSYIALHKLLFLVFCLVPWLALSIMG